VHILQSETLGQERDSSIGQSACSAAGDIGRRKPHLHFDNSKCHIACHVQEQMASQQLSEMTLDGEENVAETITEILNELAKYEVKSAVVHWKERCQWIADHNGEFYPN
jgi:hypothetical protein